MRRGGLLAKQMCIRDRDTLDYFVNEKGFQRITIPANSWKGQTEEIINAGTPDCLFVRDELDEDVVYLSLIHI